MQWSTHIHTHILHTVLIKLSAALIAREHRSKRRHFNGEIKAQQLGIIIKTPQKIHHTSYQGNISPSTLTCASTWAVDESRSSIGGTVSYILDVDDEGRW